MHQDHQRTSLTELACLTAAKADRWTPRGGTNRPLGYFPCSGRQSLKDHPIMDKVLSLLISGGITTLGAWVVTATIIKGWPFAWALLALFSLLTGIISLSGSIKAPAD
jgi:hypothetical protein